MRILWAVLVAFAVLVPALPPAASHSGGAHALPHVNPQGGWLNATETETYDLFFAESPTGFFDAGWVFVVNGIVYEGNATPAMSLLFQNRTVATWAIAPGKVTRQLTGLMPETGLYQLQLRNPGPGRVHVGFFYDQSCNCAAKPIPVEVPNGMVIFNADAQKGSTWRATFSEPAVHRLRLDLATRTDERSRWPGDFRVLQSSTAAASPASAPNARLHELTWTADATARYYVFVQSVAADYGKFDTSSPERAVGSVMVTPLFEQTGTAPKGAPSIEAALMVVTMAGLALAARGPPRPR